MEILKYMKKKWSMYLMALIFAICSILGYTVDKDMFWLDIFKRDCIFKMTFIAVFMFCTFLIALNLILKCMVWEYGGGEDFFPLETMFLNIVFLLFAYAGHQLLLYFLQVR